MSEEGEERRKYRDWIGELKRDELSLSSVYRGMKEDLEAIKDRLLTAKIEDVPTLQGQAQYLRKVIRELEQINHG